MKWDAAITTYIQFATLMVRRDRQIYRSTMMSKLENIASRAPQIIAGLEARADELDQRLTKLDKTGQHTFNKWNDHLGNQEKAIAAAEDAINRLSNSPLPDSAPEQPFPQPGAGNGATASKPE